MSKQLKELHKAATPGPWAAGRPDMGTLVDGVESKWIYASEQYVAVASGRIEGEWAEVMANAQLIAYLRNHAPDFIALIEKGDQLDKAFAEFGSDPSAIGEAVQPFSDAVAPFRSGKSATITTWS